MKKISLFISFFFLLSVYTTAQETNKKNEQELTIDDSVILAADNNVSLKRQRLSLGLLEKKKKNAWNGVSPSLSLGGMYKPPLNSNEPNTIGLNAGVRVNFSPALISSIKIARLNFEKGISSYEQAVRSIELNVRKLFYSLLLTEESLVQQQRNIESAQQRYKSNLAKFNRGQLSEVNLLTSQYNYESLIPKYESAQIDYENGLASFKQILGIPQDQPIKLKGNLEDFLTEGEISTDFDLMQIPSIKELYSQLEISKATLLSTQFTTYAPTVSASFAYDWSLVNINDVTNKNNNKSLSISASIPLDGYLPWTNNAMNVHSQKVSIKDLELQIENEKINVQISIDNSIKKIEQAKSQLKSLQKNINLAQKTYDLTLQAYNYGSADLLTLQNASDAIMNAKNTQRSQIYTLICAILDLENSLGIPFGTLVNNINQ